MRRLPGLPFPVRLDLGCGKNKIDNFVGMDELDFGQEIVWDATEGIPLPNDSVEALHSSHFFEHIRWEDVQTVLDDIVRVCKNGSRLTIIVPHSETKEAHYLCHRSLWNERVAEGIVADHPNLSLESTGRNGIHFTMQIIVDKPSKKKP